ncbi:XdhC/CoxI family protein [Desulfosporosinus sp. OT]|uniref:XdhC family protein n=1 Tax=Desulfosporosinus sp. OT TaxID=913865 RepID=UPI000223AE07|nr:XdhC/CoxI family protein [Desulfosporosinus sp. OT]EGW37567.1 xdhC and CoxI family protein [Desulfosporosinus sp. OT]
MDKEIYQGLKKVFEQNLKAALITVTSALGSTPRKPGAKMLVFADGTSVGTIGGGYGEVEVRREAFKVIVARSPKIHYLNMTADLDQEDGMVCGGIMELFIDYLSFQGPVEQTNLYKGYLSALRDYHDPILVTVLEATEELWIGKKLFIRNNGDILGDLGSEELNRIAVESAEIGGEKFYPLLISLDSRFELCEPSRTKATIRLLIEPPTTVVQLLILGAGDIAQSLLNMAKILGYEVTVVDDRPFIFNSTRYNEADRIICTDLERALDAININPQTFVVIVARGSNSDKACLRKVINQPARYIGMLGSNRKVKALKSELEKEGVCGELLQKLYSPIGLKIRAETPAEIAVSILSQVIKVQKRLA